MIGLIRHTVTNYYSPILGNCLTVSHGYGKIMMTLGAEFETKDNQYGNQPIA